MECGSCSWPGSTSGAPSSQVQALTKQLQLLVDKYVQAELLTVKECELAWIVYVDVVCLSHHGNLLDTCILAAVAALQNTKVPSLSGSDPPVMDQSSEIKLPLLTPSYTISFALLE